MKVNVWAHGEQAVCMTFLQSTRNTVTSGGIADVTADLDTKLR